ncbi:MAG: hypothetical protein JWO39_2267 [Gemmatimonadetes bacterium]|jgi:hypothetical protein|nr:hypothetical protein [Gemmatimonadota bacterium]
MRRLASVLLVFAASRAAAQTGERPCPAGPALRASVSQPASAASMPGMQMTSSAVQVDSARREIRIVAGPFRIAGMAHESDDMMMMDTPVLRVAWPVNGWVRGYSVQLCDGDAAGGTALAHEMVHHVGLANYSRRELLYPMVERLMAVGKETPRVSLPGGVGVPLARGDTLGLYSAFHDVDGKTVERAYVIVTLPWIPAGHNHPIEVMPFFADANSVIGGTSAWDLPPGRSEKSSEFTMPLSGSILALGGHVHDYARSVRLEDAQNGKVLVRLDTKLTSDGHLIALGKRVFGFHEEGLPLVANHRYRVIAQYDNPTGHVLKQGGMASMAGAFVPDDVREWPRLDPLNADVKRDIASVGSHDMVQ